MYTSFYNLNKKPFQISSDPKFMWFGEKHKEALATLKYGILDNKGFLLLTGDVGTGKTTLINALIQTLSDDVICTSVPDPGLEKMDFFNYIAAAFGMDDEFTSKGIFLIKFKKFLLKANENNKKVLLIIDEAQLLTQEMLEEIRLLSNLEKTDDKLINIFFIGQNEFNEILNREQNRAVRQRLTLNYNIDPLTPDETGEYIRYRLRIAGAEQMIFDESATQEVFISSGGFPRRINVICDHCLLSGYVNEKKIINSTIVKDCAKELKIPAYIKNRDIDGFQTYRKESVPVAKPPQYQSQPRRIVKKKKKNGLRIFFGLVFGLLLVFVTGLYMFPEHYKKSMKTGNTYAVELKDKLIHIVSESYTFLLKQKTKQENKTKEEKAFKKKEYQNQDQKTEKELIINKPIIFETTQPIQKDIQIKKDSLKVIEPQKKIDAEIIRFEKEPEKPQNSNHGLSSEKSSNPVSDTDIILEKKKEIPPLPQEKIIVRFKYNTNDFTEEGFKRLVEFADILSLHLDTKILISGYTDSEGKKDYNVKLSEFRANIVRSFFLGRRIKLDQIQIKGFGSQNPIASNETAQGRMANRRVEIQIIE